MNKTILAFIVVAVIGLVGGYLYMSSVEQPIKVAQSSSPKNATYVIDGIPVTLVNGSAESEAVPGSATKVVTQYFGNEVAADLNDDGIEDIVFLLTQSTGGTGTFFYVVAARNNEAGWQGSQGFLLGDRIAPQTTELSQNPNHQNVIVVNYMDRADNQSMSDQPSVGTSVWLKLDSQTMSWGEVEQNFSGEANPDMMTLDMKTWTWIKTTYNNDTELVPSQADAFTLTFNSDGSVSATTDCNTMSGSYEVEDNQLTFGQMAATLMFCEDSQEQEFAKMLNEVQSYFFTNKGELVFDLKFDSGSSVFR